MHAIGDYGFSGPCPFVKGRRYKVRQNFKALRSEFQAGEVLIFESRAWSRYDGITGYFLAVRAVAVRRGMWGMRMKPPGCRSGESCLKNSRRKGPSEARRRRAWIGVE